MGEAIAAPAAVLAEGGQVRGVTANGVTSFKGIPFAAPPVGPLRWRAPQPLRPWSGVREANAYAPMCPQDAALAAMMGAAGHPSSEDCLYLNVWTPALSSDERLPVMVWIYGGGFAGGTTSLRLYEGTKLAQRGVVLVSIAYRVGPFGFLAHPELSLESGTGSGNYGLLDQIAALRWVRANVARFGGDPECVTIFGESAGGTSVSMLAVSPLAQGLFHRVISQSGGSFAPGKLGDEGGLSVPERATAETFGQRFLASLGAANVAEGRALEVEPLQKAADATPMDTFGPVFDGVVLPGDQTELYLASRFHDTPVLLGTNSDEGAMFAQPGVTSASFEREIRAGFGACADDVLAAYPHASDAEAATSSKELFGDTHFAWNTWTWAKLQARKGRGKAFLYWFDHRLPLSPNGAGHGLDMFFVFGNIHLFGEPSRSEDRAMAELMGRAWVSFAKTGDPNGPGVPHWPAFDEASQLALFLDAAPAPRRYPNQKQLESLDRYYAWRREEARKRGAKR